MVPLVFSTFLAILSAPAVLNLHERGIPDALSVPLVVLGVLTALFGLGALMGSSINQFVASLPRYQQKLYASTDGIYQWLQGYGYSVDSLRSLANPGAILEMLSTTMRGLASSLSDALLIVLTVAFILLEVGGLPRKLRRALNDPEADLGDLERISREVKQYVVIKSYVSAATGLILGLFCWALGLDFPILWAVMAFLFNYIPNIGSLLAAVGPCLLAVVQFGWSRAALTLIGYVVVNLVLGSGVEPRLMGKRLGLSTLVVWLSLIFWGWLWGPIGMVLSVPLTMVVKIMLEHSNQFRAVAVLMDAPQR